VKGGGEEMAIEENTKKYDDKQATNVRIDPTLKDRLLQEADEKKKTMAEIINDMLRRRYK